jgi:hypothetical protein
MLYLNISTKLDHFKCQKAESQQQVKVKGESKKLVKA